MRFLFDDIDLLKKTFEELQERDRLLHEATNNTELVLNVEKNEDSCVLKRESRYWMVEGTNENVKNYNSPHVK